MAGYGVTFELSYVGINHAQWDLKATKVDIEHLIIAEVFMSSLWGTLVVEVCGGTDPTPALKIIEDTLKTSPEETGIAFVLRDGWSV